MSNTERRQILTEARFVAQQCNDPSFEGDRAEVSMRLAILQKRLGALGIERVGLDESDESDD